MTYGSIPFGSGAYSGSHAGFSLGYATLYVYQNGQDITGNIVRRSKKQKEQLQERVDQFSFRAFGVVFSKYDEIFAFHGSTIRGVTSTSVTLNLKENLNNLFRVGQYLYAHLTTEFQERRQITAIAITNGYLTLTLASAWSMAPDLGDRVGLLRFGGNVIDFSDSNDTVLTNQEVSVSCVDFTNLFDKILANDTFEDKDGRYIVNAMCNESINYNRAIDALDYQSNAEIQAEWTESGDGTNPTIEETENREGVSCAKFSWTYSSGTATYTASPPSLNISAFTQTNAGEPAGGSLGFWYKVHDTTKCSSFTIRIGSDSSNYISAVVTPTTTEWVFYDELLKDLPVTGTPDWTVVDYMAVIVTETASDFIFLDGIRVLEAKHFRHYPHVQETPEFENFRINLLQPTEVMQRMCDALEWFWYVDYDRYIHLFPSTTYTAPFSLSFTSDNFSDLEFSYDSSRLINRQRVQGAEETTTAYYYEVRQGTGIQREWIMKNKFVDLEVFIDNNTSTDTMEAGTDTTTVVATAHGLAVGDFIVNRTRSEVRQILTVPDVDSFTVSAVTGQTDTDTFSKFTAVTVGVESIMEDADYEYMSNYNEKTIRNSEQTPTIEAGTYIQFKYRERIPIIVQRREISSIMAMRTTLGYTNGIFDAKNPIIDTNIQTRSEALAIAQAVLNKYSNMIITATFTTYENGLETGQKIRITDTSGVRNINQDFMILEISTVEIEDGVLRHSVKCGTLLYGEIELFYQLLRQNRKISIDQDAKVNNAADGIEDIVISDTITLSTTGDIVGEEEIAIGDGGSVTLTLKTPPFKYTPSATNPAKYNLASYV